jgi:hydrogenase expression/formation protein HypE
MTMTLPPGKIPIDILREVVFKNLGAKRNEIAIGPTAGIDGAVLDIGDRSIVVSMDPITGAVERIGWSAVNVNANDVATFGVEPTFLVSCIMLSENSDRKTVEIITNQMDAAAKALGIAIVGGHCEVTLGLANPIVVGCVIGLTGKGKYVTAGGARTGDKLILTKSAGIEGTAILASDREDQLSQVFSREMLSTAKGFYNQISIVKDALTAYETGGVHAMHDPTEGGVLGGIHEMADASNLGVRVYEDKIAVEPETAKICRFFEIDPLQLIGSGALLIAAEKDKTESIIEKLAEKRICSAEIGELGGNVNKRLLMKRDGSAEDLVRPVSDHLWKALMEP